MEDKEVVVKGVWLFIITVVLMASCSALGDIAKELVAIKEILRSR